MIERLFELVPFPDPEIPKIKVAGGVVQEGSSLTVRFVVSGSVDDILIPSLDPQPGRKKGLWLATCFEFFLAFSARPQYWEFNLSPSGNWNVYRMDAYRRINFQEQEFIQVLQLDSRKEIDRFHLESVVDLSPILRAGEHLLMGISSVIQTPDGHETYWALAHPGLQADFHTRESFILALEG